MSELYCKYCGRYLCKYNEKEKTITEYCDNCKKTIVYNNTIFSRIINKMKEFRVRLKLYNLFNKNK
jgi:hypothetical protein